MVEKTLLVNIAGGHCTGLYNTATKIKARLDISYPHARICIIDLDKSYGNKSKNGENLKDYSYRDYDFDSLYDELYKMKNVAPLDRKLECKDGDDSDGIGLVSSISIIILCGCYALYDKRISNLSDLKIYVDSDSDKRLINLIREKRCSKGQELNKLLTEYMDHLRSEMNRYIQPTRATADLIIPTAEEKLSEEIIISGIFQLIESNNPVTSLDWDNSTHMIQRSKHQQPLWDFQGEFMDVEKSRYYNLS